EIEKGRELIKPLRTFGDIYGEMVGPMPYSDWQKMFDPLLTPGSRNYWKTHNFIDFEEELFDAMIGYANKLPTQQCEIFIGHIGGVVNSVDSEATAWYHRNVKYVMNVHCRWENPSDDKRCIEWGREFFEVSKPFASAGAYVNFLTEEEKDRIKSAYGKNYDRLLEIKRKYDPENMFHNNQNIKP
ncbi:MAG TPA: BBE domain-containing protein, partial [Draconibacterium sp.]|nr:BBE domain-containing protein [Draconibacterium sp.]